MAVAKRASVSSDSSAESSKRPLLNKDGSQRKSRVLSRKTDHSVIERRRREKINEKLVFLQNLVPACLLECQDLIERKYDSLNPSNDTQDAGGKQATRRGEKRKKTLEKVEKAKQEMQEKVKSSMVLEKLCIISHTVDYVLELQRENQSLRELCRGQPDSIPTASSSDRLQEHYRQAHRCASPQPMDSDVSARVRSPSTSSDDEPLMSGSASMTRLRSDESACEHHSCKKRRLHWGSDDIRKASVRGLTASNSTVETAEVKLGSDPSSGDQAHADDSDSNRVESRDVIQDSESEDETDCSACQNHATLAEQDRSLAASKPSAGFATINTGSTSANCTSAQPRYGCARHSWCRGDVQSDSATESSDELPSPVLAPISRTSLDGRTRLPSILPLSAMSHPHASFHHQHHHQPHARQEKLASLYRKDPLWPTSTETKLGISGRNPFRPLSLYTSHSYATIPSRE
ncbi:hypothetical protein BCV70DRAFT_198787 [Testicularia cyperi]|uniref:BHLH domain-containing protein n=1 Tax=Testicularia cyperi TaxID=1882483 RepID=A0A317XVF9_9BASI|nr:hypothetical protein BCV70DRAFT_198787 [Testicularia cyperi]